MLYLYLSFLMFLFPSDTGMDVLQEPLIVKVTPDIIPQLNTIDLKQGDLILQNGHCGPLCEAINTVTPAIYGRHFSHIGIVAKRDEEWTVIEATYPKVVEVPLSDFLKKSKESHWVGRLTDEYNALHEAAISFAREQIGLPYDLDYIYNNGAYYCSELVHDAYQYANQHEPIFPLYPMTFKAPGSDEFFEYWVLFYEERGIDIPEGEPGCNPGGLANFSDLIIFELVEEGK